jgi:hypothetical protein
MAYGVVSVDSIITSDNITLGGSSAASLKNRLINGGMAIDQRNSGAVQTFTAGADLAYSVDRWYAFCTGANVTGQQVAGSYLTSQYLYQFTGAASVTSIAFGQRIEAVNSYDLAGGNATISVYMANSALTSVTWTAYYANTTDAFGTVPSPTRTQIASGTITVTSTLAKYSVTVAVPTAATTGIEIVFSVGAQTGGNWLIGQPQFEKGSAATSFDYRPYGIELLLCQRYYEQTTALTGFQHTVVSVAVASAFVQGTKFMVQKRIAPTVVLYSRNGTINTVSSIDTGSDVGTVVTPTATSKNSFHAAQDSGGGFTKGNGYEYNYSAYAEL